MFIDDKQGDFAKDAFDLVEKGGNIIGLRRAWGQVPATKSQAPMGGATVMSDSGGDGWAWLPSGTSDVVPWLGRRSPVLGLPNWAVLGSAAVVAVIGARMVL